MALFTPSPQPGAYLDAQTINFTFTPEVTGVMFSRTEAPPSISKYIAYDTLNPPNPFIAVTEDGRGRVVYDGGFPKIYNNQYPGAFPTTFAGLNGAFKYMHNALKWIANPAKTAIGNNKILVLGDDIAINNYPVKSYSASGFRKSIEGICSVAGFIPTIKDRSDYNDTLNPTLAELEQYAAVWFFSTAYDNIARLTAGAINDLVAFRQGGGGILVITDHGNVLDNIDHAISSSSGFFLNANALITRFGAYFTGDYNRVPVNVGFLRSNYGDHPLYNGMGNDESIAAGGSESKVVVTVSPILNPQSLPPMVVDQPGINIINVLAITATGEIETAKYVYVLQGGELLYMDCRNPETGLVETNGGFVYSPNFDYLPQGAMELRVNAQDIGTVRGDILLNGKKIGFFQNAAGVTRVVWYAGKEYPATPFSDGDLLSFSTYTPFTYLKSSVVKRKLTPSSSMSYAQGLTHLKKAFGVSGKYSAAAKHVLDATSAWNHNDWSVRPLSKAKTFALINGMAKHTVPYTRILACKIALTPAHAVAYLNQGGTAPDTTVVCVSTNALYTNVTSSPTVIAGTKAVDIYGKNRYLQDNSGAGNGLWFIDEAGALSQR